MIHGPEQPNDAALDELVELGRQSARQPTRAELDAGLRAVRARMATGRVRRRTLTRLALLVVLIVPPVAWLYGGQWLGNTPAALTYEVNGGSVLDGGYLRESGHTGVSVAFDEGSRFVLSPGSRGRLRALGSERARVGVERGSARVQVTPETGRLWEVEAGPFLVTVKGTVFMVSWDPADERFELALKQGRVVVSGPVSGGELTLRTGQRLAVSLQEATTLITEDGATDWNEPDPANVTALPSVPPPASTVTGEPVSERASAHPSATSSAPSSAPTPAPSGAATAAVSRAGATLPKRRWAEALAHGQWDAILTDADRAGVAATLSSASSEELFALASAARYRRRTGLAHDALQALLSRFPSSPRALDALFLLGRVQETRGSGAGQALAWYDEYLARAPNGAYAAEALGRKMTIVSKTSGSTRAKSIAMDYLRRFPEGSYAGSARALLDDR